jgi:HlyD family secretion protein
MSFLSNCTKFILLPVLICAGCEEKQSILTGYIEGEYTYVAGGVAGTLTDLYVKRGEQVEEGLLLYKLDHVPETAGVEAATANIGNLEAIVEFSRIELERQKELYAQQAVPKQTLDQAQSDYDSKMQQLAAYKAERIQSEWYVDQKIMHAPVTGQVFDTFFRVGEKVPVDQPVLAILAPENIKALFYVPEKELSNIKLGQKIKFSCDSCKEKTTAKIIYISPTAEYAPPIIYSKDTRDKLIYLVRADMPKEIAQNFHPGQPIDVYLKPHE